MQKPLDIREVSRDPILPLLKRRRTAASNTTPKRNCSGPDLPVTDDVTAKESAKKRRALNEPDQTNIAAASNTEPSRSEPVVRDATEEETAAKRRALAEPDDVEEMGDMDARFPPESSRNDTATPSSTRNSKDCVDAKEKQAQQANAAEARASNTLKRGIGDLATSAELETEAAKQKAAGTREYFGASAATKLRKQLAASPAPPVRTSDGAASEAASSKNSTGENE